MSLVGYIIARLKGSSHEEIHLKGSSHEEIHQQ